MPRHNLLRIPSKQRCTLPLHIHSSLHPMDVEQTTKINLYFRIAHRAQSGHMAILPSHQVFTCPRRVPRNTIKSEMLNFTAPQKGSILHIIRLPIRMGNKCMVEAIGVVTQATLYRAMNRRFWEFLMTRYWHWSSCWSQYIRSLPMRICRYGFLDCFPSISKSVTYCSDYTVITEKEPSLYCIAWIPMLSYSNWILLSYL